MKRGALGVALAAFTVVAMTMNAANAASTTITWNGQGSDNLPCSSGGHWVLTSSGPNTTISSAELFVNGADQGAMSQNGGGSWSADSSGALSSSGTTASVDVSYTGDAPRGQLVLSSCTAGSGPTTGSPGAPRRTHRTHHANRPSGAGAAIARTTSGAAAAKAARPSSGTPQFTG